MLNPSGQPTKYRIRKILVPALSASTPMTVMEKPGNPGIKPVARAVVDSDIPSIIVPLNTFRNVQIGDPAHSLANDRVFGYENTVRSRDVNYPVLVDAIN